MTVISHRVVAQSRRAVKPTEAEVHAGSSTALIDKLQTCAVAEQLARLLLGSPERNKGVDSNDTDKQSNAHIPKFN